MVRYNEDALRQTKSVKHETILFGFLVNDMLDAFNLKHNQFVTKDTEFLFKLFIKETSELFTEEFNNRGLELKVTLSDKVPYIIVSDKERLQ